MWPHLDEHARRLVAASKAVELGYGGLSRVSRACGLSRVTLTKGVEELQATPLAPGRIRHEGGGRHALTFNDPDLAPALDGMVEPTARGDPQSPLRWTCKSTRTLAAELTARRHPVSHTKVPNSCGRVASACRAIARPRRGMIILIATRNSGTSTAQLNALCGQASPSFPSTRRRRN
jgi:hypothetical protein